MRTLTLVAAAAAVALLSSCGGGQPRYYVVSLQRAPLESLPGTCYSSGTAPTDTTTTTNQFAAQTWVVWEGADGKLYLATGSLASFDLGDATNVTVTGDAIEGGPREFTTTTVRTRTASTTTTTATFSFTELGAVMKGTLTLSSSTSCTNNCGTPACTVALPISGRQIQGDPTIIYGGGP